MTDVLKCQACFQTLTAPIKQCLKGHSVCGDCVKIKCLSQCPSCSSPITSMRNLHLEEFIKDLKRAIVEVPCKYAERGCKSLVIQSDKQDAEDHQLTCKYRVYSCPCEQFCSCDCPWTGNHENIIRHLYETHRFAMMGSNGRLKTVVNFRNGCSAVNPLKLQEKLFLCKYRVDVKCERIFWAIQYVGPKKKAQQYCYEFELFKDTTHKWKVTEVCFSDVEDIEEIFKSERCVTVSFAIAKKFADKKNTLFFRYRVVKIKEKSEEDDRVTSADEIEM